MARRSNNILAQTNAPGQVASTTKVQNFQHVQVDKVATREGMNPFAGDLTSAFNNFFGQVSDALGTMQETEFKQDMVDAKRESVRRRTIGANEALDMQKSGEYGMNAKNALDASESEFKGQYGYNQAFQEAYGNAIASDLSSEFQIQSANVSNEGFEDWAEDWWEKKFDTGTGSEIADLTVQSAFNKTFQQVRVQKAFKGIEEQREAALEAAGNSAMTYVGQPGGWGYSEFNKLFDQVQGINPTISPGKARAATLDLLAAASVAKGQNGIHNFLSFLDATDVSGAAGQPTGVTAPSLSERFPMDIAQLRQSVYQKQQAFVTAGGQQAVAQFSTKLSAVITETDGDTAARTVKLMGLQADLGKLANTPGVNMTMLAEAKSQLNDQVTTTRDLATGYAQLELLADTGQLHPALNEEEAKKLLPEMLGEMKYNFLINGDPNAGAAAGRVIDAYYKRFGDLPDDVVQMVVAGLQSPEKSQQANAINVLRNIGGGDYQIVNQAMGDEFGKLGLITASRDGSIDFELVQTNNPEIVDTRKFVRETGIDSFIVEDYETLKKEERQPKVDEFFNSVSEQIEENMNKDDGFMFFGNNSTPNISTSGNRMLRQITEDEIVKMRNTGDGSVDPDQLRKNVAALATSRMVINGGQLMPMREVPNNVIPIGNHVRNPSGIFEDTVLNMNEAVDSIPDGLRNMIIPGTGTDIIEDGDDIEVSYNNMYALEGANLYAVTSGGRSVNINIGEEMKGNLQYREDGQLYNFFQTEDNNERKFTLTGNIVSDEMILKRYVHPAIRLIPDSKTNPSFYRLAVEPHFNKVDGDTMMETELQALAESSNWIPENRRPDNNGEMSDDDIFNQVFP